VTACRAALGPYSRPLVILAPLIFVALFASLLPLQSPTAPDPTRQHQPPSVEHWFGTDAFGMDVFSRVLHGTRVDFLMTLSSVLLAIGIGVPVGAAAGYLGGVLENIVERLVEVIQAFPIMLFAMMVAVAFGKGVGTMIFVLAFYSAPFYAKLVRSTVKSLKDVEFIQAARCSGLGVRSIVFRHLIPNSMVVVISQFALSCAAAIRTVAGLSFLGLGVEVPTPEWGSMIQIGASYIVFGQWWPTVFPGLALFLSVWGLSGLGERLQERYMRGG
jgi:peptide/nickel transport system permease protein